MSQNPSSTIVDVTCQVADISSYYFLAAGAGQTVRGFYVDAYGMRTGVSFSLTLNQTDGTANALPLPNPPADAIGAIVRFSGTTYVDLASATSDDFEDSTTNYPQYSAADGNVFLGRVNA
jgi:hypothetical protein